MIRMKNFEFCIYIFALFCIVEISTGAHSALENATNNVGYNRYKYFEERNRIWEHFLNLVFGKLIRKEPNKLPLHVLDGVYRECIFAFSFTCLQKKIIEFLYELNKLKGIRLVDETISVVRTKYIPSNSAILAKKANYVNETYLKDIMDTMIDRFFDNHFVRIKLPGYYRENESDRVDELTMYIDIHFNNRSNLSTSRQGRKKHHSHERKNKPGKIKMMKKIAMIIGFMTCVKLKMMGPLVIGLLGLKAMKALILSVIALTVNKMSYMCTGGGYSEHSKNKNAIASWDRNIIDVPLPLQTTPSPFYIRPPAFKLR